MTEPYDRALTIDLPAQRTLFQAVCKQRLQGGKQEGRCPCAIPSLRP